MLQLWRRKGWPRINSYCRHRTKDSFGGFVMISLAVPRPTPKREVRTRSDTQLLRLVTHKGSLLPPRFIEARAWGNLWKWVSVQRFRTRCIATKWPSPTLSWTPQCWPQLLLSQNNTQVHIKYNCVLRFFFVFFYPQKQFLREFVVRSSTGHLSEIKTIYWWIVAKSSTVL